MIYRFDDCTLDPGSRQLTRGGARVEVPRRVFDCLHYLIEWRERAVGRDELIRQIWGRDNVSDNQLNQAVVAARRLIGSTSSHPLIRTVQGFGYQWIGTVEIVECGDTVEAVAPAVPGQLGNAGNSTMPEAAAGSGDDPAHAGADRTTNLPIRARTRPFLLAATIVVVMAVLLAIAARVMAPSTLPPRTDASTMAPAADLSGDDDSAVSSLPFWVLPAELPDDPELEWARIGLMALTGERLRRGGLGVVPLENVLMRLGPQAATPNGESRMATLGDAPVVTIAARRSRENWQVTLELQDTTGVLKRLSGSDPDLMVAAGLASEMLAIRLGAPPSQNAASLGDRLDAIRQTINGGDTSGARMQLAQLDETQQQEPEARLLGIQLELRASRLEAARDALEHLLADADIHDPLLQGRMLLLGIELARREGRPDWASEVDHAVAVLETSNLPRELAAALMARGASAVVDDRLKQAGGDFQRARRLFLSSADGIGAANALSNLGRLAILGARPREGIEQLRRAAETYSHYGAIDREFVALSSMIAAQAHLLLWNEALSTAERSQRLLARVADPAARELLLLRHAQALIETGRLTDARHLLDGMEPATESPRPPTMDPGLRLRTRAALSAAAGDHEHGIEAAGGAFALGYSQLEGRTRVSRSSRESRDHALLLWMSNMVMQRRSVDARHALPLSAAQQAVLDAPDTVPAWIAAGLWHDDSGRPAAAESAFRSALQMAEGERTLAYLRTASGALIEFLISAGRIHEANELLDLLHAQDDGGLEHDFQAGLLALRVRHAERNVAGWQQALKHATGLAGERPIPALLQGMPGLPAARAP
jgi:DNA-binding winged helix-turn-helix (wHTH) protein/tetratricopeptide (TPR) repeat protein